ncbi:hypothetical protein GCM10011506_18080 [Marivirga lumbricoides]|uniref:Anti-sigma factor n=1 Tax=Marivirga lumbricoides TaxID=1046115 RepID=A0ABQ1M4J1_9BACT|nr:hypothetical protein GCM10011506_18080 [Marivirga lumbricoides]
MESNKIDELFKKKLERHSQPVSADAWSEIRSQMKQKKKSKPIVWYVAASVSLLFLVSFGISTFWNNQQESNLAINPINLDKAQNLSAEAEVPAKPELIKKKEEASESVKQQNITHFTIQKPAQQLANNTKTNASDADKNAVVLNKISGKGADISLQLAEVTTIRVPDLERKSDIKVEMYYEENESLAASSSTPAPLNSLNKSASKLKSLASELSLADLRSAKNQLFASAFQTNKKSVNN